MKILQVITSLNIGGAEKLLVDIVPFFKAKGYDMDILLFNGKDTPFKKQLQDQGIQVYCLTNETSGYYNPLFLIKIIPFLAKYDIIHTHNTACQYLVVLAKLLSFSRTKLVTTEHSTSNRRRNISLFKPIDRFIYKRYIRIITISPKATDMLVHYLGYAKNIHTICNGINLQYFQHSKAITREEIQTADNSVVITMVGGFRIEKDQDTLIKAMALLPDNYCLWLVGDGIRKKRCQTLAKEYNLESRIVFTGLRSDIPQLLKASDVVVMSSHWEGFGLAALEGMAVGKPVIASDVPGLAEVVNGAGILFEKGNVDDLSCKIKHLINDRVYYRATASRCLDRALKYDISIMTNAYENLYKDLISI